MVEAAVTDGRIGECTLSKLLTELTEATQRLRVMLPATQVVPMIWTSPA